MADDARLPVGRDCDCGHPLVWRDGKQWCSVYGSHPVTVYGRDKSAEFAALVDLCAETPNNSPRAVRHRERSLERYHRLRAVS